MKLEFLLLLSLVLLTSVFGDVEKNMLKFEGEGDVNTLFDKLRKTAEGISSKSYKKWDFDDSESSGDVDDNEISGDDEGSGPTDEFSGNDITTTHPPTKETDKTSSTPAVVDITLVSSTKETTTISNCVDCDWEEEETDEEIDPVNSEEREGNDEEDLVDTPGKKPNNQRMHGKHKKKKVVNFTVGIIVGVVVGAVLAILIIIFLVYRLRKKDEGSYSLDEQSSTAYLRGDTDSPKGKEYFA